MQTLYFAYPGDIDTPTGGYGYDRRIIAGLRDLGRQVELVPLGEGFPFPPATTLQAARDSLAGLPEGSIVVADGLAFGAMGDWVGELAERLNLIALVHHPLCRENGLSAGQAAHLRDSEHKALACAGHVIVTSPSTSAQVADLFCVPTERITVVLPGTDKKAPIVREPSGNVKLLSVGTVVPRKGYDLLFQALSGLKDLDWRLDIVGGLDADPDCHRALLDQAHGLEISERIIFHGAVPPQALSRFYLQADIFVLASRYEGYGMAYAEAIAHGLPVIGSGGGAVRETLPQGAAIYCGTEDVAALETALSLLISEPGQRAEMAAAAHGAAGDLPGWDEAAMQFEKILREAGA